MIWPWSELKNLRQQMQSLREQELHTQKWNAIYQRLYIEKARDLAAAHKGIRRLVTRVERLKKGVGE